MKKEKTIRNALIGLPLLFILIWIVYWLAYINPLSEQTTDLKQSIQNEKIILESLRNKEESVEEQVAPGVLKLIEELPPKKYLENFLLQLEKVETKSSSTILSMTFGSEEAVTEDETLEDLMLNESEETEQEAENVETGLVLPKGLERLRIDLLVESPSYYEFYKFLEEVESLERIVSVESINFSNPYDGEGSTLEDYILNSTVTLFIYYFPPMEELSELFPEIDVPDPSEKFNPLTPHDLETSLEAQEGTGETQVDDGTIPAVDLERQDETTSLTADPNQPEVVFHEVQEGETLFSIAMKYYGDRAGENDIKKYNNLSGSTVYEGTILKIPLYDR